MFREIEAKKTEINKLKDALKTERVLLTKELIEEREEEIAISESELLDYQEKRFGPKGDLIIQKSVLVKPIQDQIFTNFLQIEAIGQGLYTYGAILLIICSMILLLAMVAPIFISRNIMKNE